VQHSKSQERVEAAVRRSSMKRGDTAAMAVAVTMRRILPSG
jgi:hypothetical protein